MNRRLTDAIPLPIRRTLGGAAHRGLEAVLQKALLWRLRGDAVECNICGWQGARFTDDIWHRGTICPVCRSQVRHRLLMAVLMASEEFSLARLFAEKEVLHFAPEQQTGRFFSAQAKRYVSADFERGDVDCQLDISAMPAIADSSIDTVIVCDVFEHVPEDRRALGELRRILRPGGIAILTVPQPDDLARTDEDFTVTDQAERVRRFGQKDHVRIYGEDFAARIAGAGFALTVVTAADLPEAAQRRHVLTPPEPSPHPLATNRRRLYFCRAPVKS